jgi:hypothetical protein
MILDRGMGLHWHLLVVVRLKMAASRSCGAAGSDFS